MSSNCPNCGHEFEIRVRVDPDQVREFLDMRDSIREHAASVAHRLTSFEQAIERGARKGTQRGES